jgi:hypothetical protein
MRRRLLVTGFSCRRICSELPIRHPYRNTVASRVADEAQVYPFDANEWAAEDRSAETAISAGLGIGTGDGRA